MPGQQTRKEKPEEQKRSPQPQGSPPSSWREAIIWVLIPLVLIIWNIVALWPKPHPEVTIPYSAFLAQARSGNVAKVHIVGDEITGSFVKPLLWPEPGETTTPSASPNSKTAPTAKPKSASPSSPPAVTYNEFQTTFPSPSETRISSPCWKPIRLS